MEGKKTFVWAWVQVILGTIVTFLGLLSQHAEELSLPAWAVGAVLAASGVITAALRYVTTTPPAEGKIGWAWMVGLAVAIVAVVGGQHDSTTVIHPSSGPDAGAVRGLDSDNHVPDILDGGNDLQAAPSEKVGAELPLEAILDEGE